MVKENDSVYVDWQDQLKIQITVLDSCFLLVHWMLKVILITFLIPCKFFFSFKTCNKRNTTLNNSNKKCFAQRCFLHFVEICGITSLVKALLPKTMLVAKELKIQNYFCFFC